MKLPFFVLAGACVVLNATPAQAAPPPNFPDFANFDVVTDTHLAPYRNTTQQVVKFVTPDGLSCGIGALAAVGTTVRCYGYGPVPGATGVAVIVDPTAKAACDFGMAQLHGANEGTISRYRGDCPTDLAGGALLAPAQRVSLGTATCGVAVGGVTACIDTTGGGHGFVLQPTGSWVF